MCSMGWWNWLLEDEFKVVTYSSESVVIDKSGKQIISCPTEKEAWEYILDKKKNTDKEN